MGENMSLPIDQQEALDDFCEYRRTENPKPFGNIAEKRLRIHAEKLYESGYDLALTANHAIQAGWLNLYPRDDMKRVRRQRETQVTVLAEVKVDKELAKQHLKAMKAKAK